MSRIKRVLEVEVMDSAADAEAYDSMDHELVNRLFVDDFLAAAGGNAQSVLAEILDLGTGTARIPIELCRRTPLARVLAVDLAASMIELAERNVARAGLAAQIRLDRIDAKRLPYADGRFSSVISNSIVHHIPEPRDVLAGACRVLTRGGLLFVRDLLRPADGRAVRELVDLYAADCDARQRQLFDDSLRAALSLDEIRGLCTELGFDPATVRQTSDRHWTWTVWKNAE
jgi:ubiquinone/menaquinone biosynthesis C-methylase UbiE